MRFRLRLVPAIFLFLIRTLETLRDKGFFPAAGLRVTGMYQTTRRPNDTWPKKASLGLPFTPSRPLSTKNPSSAPMPGVPNSPR